MTDIFGEQYMNKRATAALIAANIFFLVPLYAPAAFDIPAHVYLVSELNTAQAQAISNGEPITFIYSNKDTDCGLATSASMDIFNSLNDYSAIVYAERKDWGHLPAVVQEGLHSPKAGKYIPQTVIVDANFSRVIYILPYAKTKQRAALIKQAQEMISGY